ncbi:hypothetical protein ACFC0P_05140, partial [Streptomyces broussonetiae]
ESHWSHDRPGYRCRHGHTSATRPDPGRIPNTYVREDHVMRHLPALHLRLTGHMGVNRESASASARLLTGRTGKFFQPPASAHQSVDHGPGSPRRRLGSGPTASQSLGRKRP